MEFQSDPDTIRWKIHFQSPRDKVFEALATNSGRARFWAESAPEKDGVVTFHFLNHPPISGRILASEPPTRFTVEYFDAVVDFRLADDGAGGTDLTLVSKGDAPEQRTEIIAGWVSVLMTMKAAVDFDVDLRNHDPSRTWSQGYADN